jgi:DNA-binding MarR family transcriptional regulator
MAGADDDLATSERLLGLPTRLLGQAALYVERMVDEGLAEEDARKWHYVVLVTLREFGPASQADLSRRTGIYRSDMVAFITELAARHLVQRAPDPTDQRRNIITLTSQGQSYLRRLDKLVDRLQDEALAPLTLPEREQLTKLLRRLFDYHATSSPPPPHDEAAAKPVRVTRKR